MHLRSLEQAPIANDYLKALQHDETLRDFRPVPAGQVKLTPGGLLAAGDQTFELAGAAHTEKRL